MYLWKEHALAACLPDAFGQHLCCLVPKEALCGICISLVCKYEFWAEEYPILVLLLVPLIMLCERQDDNYEHETIVGGNVTPSARCEGGMQGGSRAERGSRRQIEGRVN